MRLTAELIASAPAYINPIKEREINLRGFKIAHIENLGVTNDEYEVIDLSDNEITKLDNLPLLSRLTTLLLSNNRINKLQLDLNRTIPKLESLILTNNRLSSLSDLDPLACLTSLRTLSLLQNPCTRLPDYRAYLIHLLPNLRLIDFNKVKPKERDAALLQFGPPPTSASIQAAIAAASGASSSNVTIEKPLPGQAVPQGQAISLNMSYAQPSSYATPAPPPKLTQEEFIAEKKRLVGLITAATNLEEVNALQKQLEVLTSRQSA